MPASTTSILARVPHSVATKLLLQGRYQTLHLSRLGDQRVLDGTPLHDEVLKA